MIEPLIVASSPEHTNNGQPSGPHPSSPGFTNPASSRYAPSEGPLPLPRGDRPQSRVRPPWTGVGKRIESAVRKALYDFELVEGVERVTVALSGGKDSLCLLLMLHAISGRGFGKFELAAAHVGGEFSCGAGVNLEFLEGVCRELGVPLFVRESSQKLETLECYSCSRERRRLLFEMAKEWGARHVAFGHHRDDSAETLMLNLLHKGEFAANLPKVEMEDYGVVVIRPLIYCAEEEIRAFARIAGFARITCQCPVGAKSARRRVKDWLKMAEELFPNAGANLARAGLLYGSDKASRKGLAAE